MNALMNLWVSFTGRTLLCEVNFSPVQEILFGQCISAFGELCICQSVRIRHFVLCSQKVLKCAVTNVIEFRSSRKNIFMKIHANIFV